MQYWLLTTEFPPHFGGGIATYCVEMVSALFALGVKPTVFVPDYSLSVDKTITEDGYRVVRFHPGRLVGDHLPGRAGLSYAFKQVVIDALSTFDRPEVIESQDYCGLTYFLSMEKLCGNLLLKDIPIAVMMHTPEYAVRPANASVRYLFPEYWNDELERFSLKAADMVWAPSHKVLSMIEPDLLTARPQVIRNPYTMPSEPDEEPNTNLLYFGRVQRLKGIEPFIAAYNRLVEAGLQDQLDIIGGDSSYDVRGITMMEHLKKSYRPLIERQKLQFLGLMDRKIAMTKLRRAKVVAIPSLYENFSYAALEAMSLGRVVVTSRQCGHTEVMQSGFDGFIFDHDIPGDLDDKLDQALRLSPGDWARIGRNARATVAAVCHPTTVVSEKLEAVRRFYDRPAESSEGQTFPFLRLARTVDVSKSKMSSGYPEPENGLLSIIIPYFNLEAYLAEAIKSALAVDYKNVEIIVLNASSTKTESIAEFYRLKSFYQSTDCIRFVHIKDKGLADTRNRGVTIARGEFVTFLDADDLVERNYYSRAVEILVKYKNVGFVGCWVQYFEGNDGKWITWNAEPPYLLFHNTMNSASAVYRRAAYLEAGGNDVSMFVGMEDYESIIRIVACGYGGVAIPEFLFNYRVRRDSMMRQLAPRSNIYNYQIISEKNPEIYRKHAIDLIGLLNANGPGYRHDNPLVPAGFG